MLIDDSSVCMKMLLVHGPGKPLFLSPSSYDRWIPLVLLSPRCLYAWFAAVKKRRKGGGSASWLCLLLLSLLPLHPIPLVLLLIELVKIVKIELVLVSLHCPIGQRAPTPPSRRIYAPA